MPRHVEHIVDAAGDPVVTVLVAAAAVTREVVALVLGEVRLLEALVIAPHRARLPRPGRREAERARDPVALEHATALGIDQHGRDPEQRQRRRARLRRGHARQRRDQDAAGLRLPPRVHDRAASLADHVVIPAPDLGIDRFADRTQDAQAATRVALHMLVAGLRDRAQRGGRGVQDGDAEIVDHAPVATRIGIHRRGLEHHGGGAVRERAVEDVRVPGHPADVGRTAIDVTVAMVEHEFVRERGVDHVAAGRVQHALGLPGAARGVEDEQRILGAHPRHGARAALATHLLVEPQVASGVHRDLGRGAARDEHGLDHGQTLDGLVGDRLERDRLAAAQPLVRGDDDLAAGIEDAIAQGFRGEATEHDRMHRTDARARQHRVCGLGDHRHVDADAIALAHAVREQHVREPTDLVLELTVAHVPIGAGLVTGPQDRGLLATRVEMTIDAVEAGVESATQIPAEVDRIVVGVHDRVPRMEPRDALRLLRPELLGMLDRTAVRLLVLRARRDAGVTLDVRRDGVEFLGHDGLLRCGRS